MNLYKFTKSSVYDFNIMSSNSDSIILVSIIYQVGNKFVCKINTIIKNHKCTLHRYCTCSSYS